MVIYILAALILIGGLVLLFVTPVAGIIFILIGIGLIVWQKKLKKAKPAAAAPVPTAFKEYKIAGISYREDALLSIAEENEAYGYGKKKIEEEGLEDEDIFKYTFPDYARLEKEPTNEHDKNAIKVIVGGEHIGYIYTEKTEEVAALMDSGKIQKILADIGGGDYKNYNSEDEEMEKGTKPFFGSVLIYYEK